MMNRSGTIFVSIGRLRHAFAAVVLAVLAAGQAPAQTFTAAADRNPVAANEQFQVTFTVNGPDVNSVRDFRAPNFSQFVVMSGPNQSTSMQWINGKMSGSIAYTYVLYARTPGKYTIGNATVSYGGKTLSSEPLKLDVGQARAQTVQNAQGKQQAAGTVDIGTNLFIRAVPSKTRARMGEQISVTYKLYTRLQLYDMYLPKVPAYDGFWSETLEQPQQPQFAVETYEGKQYNVAVIRKVALFPTQPGAQKLEPFELRCKVLVKTQKRSNDPFDSFFDDPFFNRGQAVEQDLKSNPLTITVDPLPHTANAAFSGAVGSFTFSATIDRKEVKAGDPVTLKVNIAGRGNVKIVTLPKPALPADFEAYDPKLSDNVKPEGGVIRGTKSAEYLIVPRNAGRRTIEPLVFTYFDLDRNAYVSLSSPKFDINVLPGKEIAPGSAIASKEDIRLLGEDIRFLKLLPGGFTPVDSIPFATIWFVLGLMVPPFALAASVLYRRRLDRIHGNMSSFRFQKAGREAVKRLKRAKKLLEQGNTEQYHAELSRALLGYLGDKLKIPQALLTLEEASARLEARQVAPEVVQQMKECVERAEFARFAPGADSQEARQEVMDAAVKAINDVERAFSA